MDIVRRKFDNSEKYYCFDKISGVFFLRHSQLVNRNLLVDNKPGEINIPISLRVYCDNKYQVVLVETQHEFKMIYLYSCNNNDNLLKVIGMELYKFIKENYHKL